MDECVGPHRFEQLRLSYDQARTPHQILEYAERFRSKRDPVVPVPDALIRLVEPEWRELLHGAQVTKLRIHLPAANTAAAY